MGGGLLLPSCTSLAAIKQLNLLQQLYEALTIPEAVYRELARVNPPVPGTVEVQTAGWIQVQRVSDNSLVTMLEEQQQLDEGESEAIALAIELNAELLLIDERRGRAEADRLGLRITGLLGVLIEAKRNRLIVAVKPVLNDLIETAEFRVSDALYAQILQMVGE